MAPSGSAAGGVRWPLTVQDRKLESRHATAFMTSSLPPNTASSTGRPGEFQLRGGNSQIRSLRSLNMSVEFPVR